MAQKDTIFGGLRGSAAVIQPSFGLKDMFYYGLLGGLVLLLVTYAVGI
jgi:hypothetical protein